MQKVCFCPPICDYTILVCTIYYRDAFFALWDADSLRVEISITHSIGQRSWIVRLQRGSTTRENSEVGMCDMH